MPRARTETETLESGKAIVRLYDDESGHLVSEEHSHGTADIAITLVYEDGKKIAERYICKRRLVKRKKYEEARRAFPDMPAADTSIRDASAELVQLEAEEKRQSASARQRHVADAANAKQNDEFCLRILEAGRHALAKTWLAGPQRSLGEMTPEDGRQLIAKLEWPGATAIHICQIRAYPDGTETSGHLVLLRRSADPVIIQRRELRHESALLHWPS